MNEIVELTRWQLAGVIALTAIVAGISGVLVAALCAAAGRQE